jgi:hypothetical protein
MTTPTTEAVHCPTCGARVEVASSDEGTQHYVPVTVRDVLLALRAKVVGMPVNRGSSEWLDRHAVLALIDKAVER